MQIRLLTFASLCAASLLLFPSIVRADATPKRVVEQLDNGLTIVVQEHKAAPVVTVQGWVNSGSTTEGDLTGGGMSHYLEHMLFKGTERRDVGQMGLDVKAIGGATNAYTSFDRTVYYVNADSAKVNEALDIVSDILTNATFPQEELDKERDVIHKEINRGLDDPQSYLSYNVLRLSFIQHPYQHPVIGYGDVLDQVTRDDLLAYYKKFYVPNNMALIIVGDVDADAVVAEARRLWADVPRRPLAEPVRPIEPSQLSPRTHAEERDAQLAYVSLSYHTVALSHPDLYALDVLSHILSTGRSSRLYKEIRETQQLVHGIGSYSYTPRDAGIFGISLQCDPDKHDAAIEATMAEIERVQRRGVTRAEVETAQQQVVARRYFGQETASSIAESLGTGLFLTGDLDFDNRYVEGIQRVTRADVRRVAQQYLVPEGLTTVTIFPRGTQPKVGSDDQLAAFSEPLVRTLDNGVRIIVRENHANPIVSMRVLALGGARSEPLDKIGVTTLMASVMPTGTEKWSGERLAQLVDARGGSYSAYGGRNSWGASVSMLSADVELAASVLSQVALHPTFPEDAFEREKRTQLAAIRAQEESVNTVAQRILREEMYPNHPQGFLTSGTAETAESLTVDDLIAHHARMVDPRQMVISVAGDVTADAVVALFEPTFGSLQVPEDSWKAVPPPAFIEHAGKVTRDVRSTAQTVIMVAFPGVAIDDPRSEAIDVFARALNGQGGRLFRVLRDERGLAYSVGFFQAPSLDTGMLVFYIATTADLREKAIAGMWEQIAELRESGLTEEEIEDSKRIMVSQQASGLQANDDFAMTVGLNVLYGFDVTHHEGLGERLTQITPALIRETARSLLNEEFALVVDVGPESPK